jgi:hypothetical protein
MFVVQIKRECTARYAGEQLHVKCIHFFEIKKMGSENKSYHPVINLQIIWNCASVNFLQNWLKYKPFSDIVSGAIKSPT